MKFLRLVLLSTALACGIHVQGAQLEMTQLTANMQERLGSGEYYLIEKKTGKIFKNELKGITKPDGKSRAARTANFENEFIIIDNSKVEGYKIFKYTDVENNILKLKEHQTVKDNKEALVYELIEAFGEAYKNVSYLESWNAVIELIKEGNEDQVTYNSNPIHLDGKYKAKETNDPQININKPIPLKQQEKHKEFTQDGITYNNFQDEYGKIEETIPDADDYEDEAKVIFTDSKNQVVEMTLDALVNAYKQANNEGEVNFANVHAFAKELKNKQ